MYTKALTGQHNDDKIVDVENIVKFENATDNNVEVEELFEDDKS